ncbi:MAG: peptidoglycan DD-metalloendopeptidase family protein [Rhodospirillales bacterium]|nr:peptidoglycan DD-metalloendopeptidase family protein [Rhodospirillales bacterium]
MRRNRTTALKVISLLLFSLAVPIAAAAQNVGGGLKEAERELQRSQSKSRTLDRQDERLGRELGQLRRARVLAARQIQALEAKINELETEVRELDAAEKAKNALLADRRAQYAEVLSAIHRMSLFPPEAVVVQPLEPADLVRTAILLQSTVPRLQDQASRIRDDLSALNETRDHILESRRRLEDARKEIDAQRGKLALLQLEKSRERDEIATARRAEARRLAALTAKVTDLRDLFGRLEADRERALTAAPRPEPRARPGIPAENGAGRPAAAGPAETALWSRRPISLAKGRLPPPVVGRVKGRYGEVLRPGITRKGIEIETAARAQVVAPYDGKVVFAGDFRGYGQLLIIEHSEGYHSLLAGMTRIDGAPGQWLLAGEPVGVMGPAAEEKPSLYVEFRRKGQPINPLPWLVAQTK